MSSTHDKYAVRKCFENPENASFNVFKSLPDVYRVLPAACARMTCRSVPAHHASTVLAALREPTNTAVSACGGIEGPTVS